MPPVTRSQTRRAREQNESGGGGGGGGRGNRGGGGGRSNNNGFGRGTIDIVVDDEHVEAEIRRFRNSGQIEIEIMINWWILSVFNMERRLEIEENIRRTLHGALHSHICGHAFNNIPCVRYESQKPPAKKKRDGETTDDGRAASASADDENTAASTVTDKEETIHETAKNKEIVDLTARSGETTVANDRAVATAANDEETTVQNTTGSAMESEITASCSNAKEDAPVERSQETTAGGKRKFEDEAEEERCPICLVDYEHDEEIKQLDCDHKFHCECLETWFQDQATCPCCRQCVACSPPNEIRITFPDTWSFWSF